MKRISIVFFFLVASFIVKAQDFKTLTYFVNDSTKLELDLFVPKTKSGEKLPLLIHVHGGGFGGGQRKDGHHICSYASQHGYAAATITYTLYMKDKNFSCGGVVPEKGKGISDCGKPAVAGHSVFY